MTLKTSPTFYYGIEIDKDYTWIDFQEGYPAIEKSVKLAVGNYSMEDLRKAIEDGFNLVGDNTYTVQIDRYTRIITIISDGAFILLNQTGTHSPNSLLVYVGFGSTPIWGEAGLYGTTPLIYGAIDSPLQFIHQAKFPIGFEYTPQFCMHDYLDADDNNELREAQVNESISGDVIEVIYFGTNENYQMNFKYITDLPMPFDGPIRNNQNAKAEINAFLSWAITKRMIIYFPDLEDRNTFFTIRLEKGAGGKGGVGYSLKELTPKLPDFFETGKMTFRRLKT